jgi:hypothetical protein
VNTASHNKRKRFSKKDTEPILVVDKQQQQQQQQQQQETKFTIVPFWMNHSSLMIF